MENKSKIYGGYGGVTKQNHYVPPPCPPFIPQPASIPFCEEYASATSELLSSAQATKQFLMSNEGNIMRRHLVSSTETQETYRITTLDNPTDVITYTTTLSGTEDLLKTDGGFF
jgi:hypothetical protein